MNQIIRYELNLSDPAKLFFARQDSPYIHTFHSSDAVTQLQSCCLQCDLPGNSSSADSSPKDSSNIARNTSLETQFEIGLQLSQNYNYITFHQYMKLTFEAQTVFFPLSCQLTDCADEEDPFKVRSKELRKENKGYLERIFSTFI
jgi:hypothetical protein